MWIKLTLMKKLSLYVFLVLMVCNTARALPECEGNEFDWTNCYGTAVYAVGTYEGEFYDGSSHGKGTMTYLNGDKFVGSWKEGEIDGYGTYYYKDGSSTFGIWYKNNLKKSTSGIFQSSSPLLIVIILILLLKFFAKKFYNYLIVPIKKGLRLSNSMKGNASRTEYNIYFLFLFSFLAFSMHFLYVISTIFPDLEMLGVYYIWYFAYAIFMLISGIALTLRRLNDLTMGRTTIIVLFIPIIGFIFSLLLCVLPSAAKKRRR